MDKLVAIENWVSERKGLHICWFLHNRCNFHCSYCWDVNHNGKAPAPSFEKVIEFLENIFKSYADKNLIHFSFTGGEPTLWPDFENLCCYLSERKCCIGMTTNGSNTTDFWQRVSSYFNWICLSYHPEKADPQKTLENIEIIRQRTQLTIRVMMHPQADLWERSLAFSKKLTENPDVDWIRIEFVPLQEILGSNESKFYKYSKEQNEFFEKNAIFERFTPEKKPPLLKKEVDLWTLNEVYADGSKHVLNSNRLIIRNLHHFTGWECSAGQDLLFIDHLQDVWRATCHVGGKIGNVHDSDISFPKDNVICCEKACVCETDLQIPKRKR